MNRLEGKMVLITGSASGIGRATAKLFAKEGARLTLCDIKASENDSLAKEIQSDGGEALAIPTDVGEPEAVHALFARLEEQFGRLDVLFIYAGTGAPAVLLEEE